MDRFYNKPTGFGTKPLSWSVRFRLDSIKRNVAFMRDERLQGTGGNLVKITFDRWEKGNTNPNARGKTFPVIRVFGTALSGKNEGQEWSTQIFANNRELASQVKALNKGETVDVKMKQNGNYWNAESFTVVTDIPSDSGTRASSGSGTPIMSAEAMEKDTRARCLEIASKIVGDKKAKTSIADHMMEIAGVADMAIDYINKDGAFQFDRDTVDGIPEELPEDE